MQYTSNKGYNGWGLLGMLLTMTGLGIVLGALLQFVISLSMIPNGTPVEDILVVMQKQLSNPKHAVIMRWIQIVGTFCILCVPALLFSLICNGKEMIWLGLSKYLKPVQVVIGFFLIFLSNIIAGPLTDLTRYIVHWIPDLEKSAIRMEAAYETAVQSMTYIKGFPDFLMSLLVMAVLPAVFEELFFRGALQNLLAKWWRKPILAVIVVSLIFSLTHASIYLFPARFILGFALGWMYFLTRNLWVNIFAHFLNNAIVVVQMYYYSSQNKKIPLDKMDLQVDWWIALFALVCLIYLFRKMKEKSEVTIMKIHAKEQLLEAQYKKDIWAGG